MVTKKITVVLNFLQNKSNLILAIVLLFSLLLRLIQLDFPLTVYGGEGLRDYFVANHIIAYHEYPLIGPYNSGSGGTIFYSPFYYYFLSFFLLLHNSILFLGIIAIVLQLFTIIFLFYLADRLFGKQVAYITVVIYSTIPQILFHSLYVWPAFVMEPFLYASYFFIFMFFIIKKIRYALAGHFFLILAGVINNVAFASIPFFFVCTIVTAWKYNLKRVYFYLLPLYFLCGSIFYFPVYIYLRRHTGGGKNLLSAFVSFPNFLQQLRHNIDFLLGILSLQLNTIFSFQGLVIFGIILCYLYGIWIQKEKRIYHFLLIAVVIEQLLLVSLLKQQLIYYLTPIVGLVIIIISSGLGRLVTKSISRNCLLVSFLIIIMYITTNSFNFNLKSHYSISNATVSKEVSITLVSTIKRIKNKDHFANFQFFNIVAYRTGGYYNSPAVLLVPLESALHEELAKSTNTSESLIQNGFPKYIFLSCLDNNDLLRNDFQCIQSFNRDYNKRYNIQSRLYFNGPLTVYLTSIQ